MTKKDMLRCILRSKGDKHTNKEWFETIRKGDLEDIKHLYTRIGEDINIQDERGMTALHHAIEANHTAAIDWLIANGAKLNKLNKESRSPLYIATDKGNSMLVEKLVRRGAHLQINTKKNTHVLQPIHIAVRHGHLDILYHLLEHGAKADIEGPDGETALNIARKFNQREAERIILKYSSNC